MTQSIRRTPTIACLVALATALLALSATTACAEVPEIVSQTIPNGVKRVLATTNANIDIDGKDDERVDVDVAVFDRGINLSHPDLNLVGGANCRKATAPTYTCTSGPGDDDPDIRGHGTMVAEVIGSIDNGIGYDYFGSIGVGAAPGARIWGVDVRNDEGWAALVKAREQFAAEEPWEPVEVDLSAVIAAVKWVTAHADQIEVFHLSMDCSTDPEPDFPRRVCLDEGQVAAFEEAIEEAIEAGVVVVAPAGNSNEEINGPTHFGVPARIPGVIAVAAIFDSDGLPGGKGPTGTPCNPHFSETEADDTEVDGSAFGTAIDLTAPGTCTSFSSPYASAAAAILASRDNPENAEDVEAIRDAIVEAGNTKSAAEGGWDDESGDGFKEPLVDVGDEELFDPEMVQGSYPLPVDSDVNGDGRADLVALRANGVAYVHPGGSDSKFGTGVSSFSGSPLNVAQYDGSGHYAVDVADVDGDKRTDLVTLTDDGDVHVYRGKADSTFAAAVTSELGMTPGLLEVGGHEPIAVADVNGDSYADLVSHDGVSDQVEVYPGASDASFGAAVIARTDIASALHTGIGHHFVDAADVDGDNRADLVSLTSSGDLSVFRGRSLATLSDPVTSHKGEVDPAMDDGSGYEPLGLGDTTGDGRADLALFKGGYAYLYRGEAAGSFQAAVKSGNGTLTSTAFDPSKACELFGPIDVNGDGRADLVCNLHPLDQIRTAAGNADGTLSLGSPVTSAGTFPSTQHEENQGEAGNQFLAEKPSWRRRGCHAKGCGWVIEPNFNAGGGENRFTDVSCTAASFCMATANLLTGSGWSYSYTQLWNGSTWSFRGVPENLKTELTGISCTSSSFCLAVGSRKQESGKVINLAYSWDGSKWSELKTNNVEGGDNRLTDVSCTSSSFCFASAYLTSGGTDWAYAETWDGSKWTHRGGIPENGGTRLMGASCTSSSACTAVGSKTSGSEVKTFAMRWDGKWSLQEVPNAQGGNNHLTDVSCTSSTFCHATGYLVTSGTWAYGRVWNGSTWTSTGGVPPQENGGIVLGGISCTSATSCTAAGTKTVEGDEATFAAHWNGSKWRRQATPNASEADHSRLTGVSCVASSCTAVGSYTDGEEDSNLAMRLP